METNRNCLTNNVTNIKVGSSTTLIYCVHEMLTYPTGSEQYNSAPLIRITRINESLYKIYNANWILDSDNQVLKHLLSKFGYCKIRRFFNCRSYILTKEQIDNIASYIDNNIEDIPTVQDTDIYVTDYYKAKSIANSRSNNEISNRMIYDKIIELISLLK